MEEDVEIEMRRYETPILKKTIRNLKILKHCQTEKALINAIDNAILLMEIILDGDTICLKK